MWCASSCLNGHRLIIFSLAAAILDRDCNKSLITYYLSITECHLAAKAAHVQGMNEKSRRFMTLLKYHKTVIASSMLYLGSFYLFKIN